MEQKSINNSPQSEFPFSTEKVPVSSGIEELQKFLEGHKGYTFCLYLADKTQEAWDISTSRVYMNQVVPGLIYLPVNIPKDDVEALERFFSIAQANENVVAVNITQPHKSNAVVKELFSDTNTPPNIDALVKNSDGKLAPYDLNGPSFMDWYIDEVGPVEDKTVLLVGVGGVGETLARALAKNNPRRLILVDHNDKSQLVDELSSIAKIVESFRDTSQIDIQSLHDLIVINAAGKEGVLNNSALTVILQQLENKGYVFVDLRPQQDIDIVNQAEKMGWKSYTGYGMNARNDYTLLCKIAEILNCPIPTFTEFQRFVLDAS